MADLKASGTIRVERRGNQVSLNVFGTYALLSVDEAESLVEALDDIVEEVADGD